MYAEILTNVKVEAVDHTFVYKFDNHQNVQVGMRVLVPFGNQKLEGFVLKIMDKTTSPYKIKNIIEVLDTKPILNKELLELGKYISYKTLAPLIMSYEVMLPIGLKARKKKVEKKYNKYIALGQNPPITENQKKIYNVVKQNKKVLKQDLLKISSYITNKLLEQKVFVEIKEESYRLKDNIKIKPITETLTQEQQEAINQIKLNQFKPYLIHGVTGSGKTLVYIKLIEKIMKQNKEAILLVPEISLTPQVVKIFKQTFGQSVAILHSKLSYGEKYDEWRKIEEKKVKIVIGARSAIFAPFTNLGIIIIDEEHSYTYKQENTPRYHTIDIAIKRAKTYNIPLVLGSATPSIESYTRTKLGIYQLIEMKKRINNNLPKVYLIDMKEEIKTGHRILSQQLENKITEELEKHNQILILLNRRGFSTVFTCQECGYTHKCPNCDIPLTYHKSSNSMKCHYCEHVESKLTVCPVCKSKNINQFGLGTEKLQEYIEDKFSQAKTVRMDIDSTSKKGGHSKIINDFQTEKYNILIGTQMIAKGLDFPKVTLVGIINGDASLNIPDFRSAERTFELLNQAAGRAGRGKQKGEVIIQGFNINHYSIQYAALHDYENFYKKEINIRKKLKYPPFYNLLLIKIQGKNYNYISQESSKIKQYLNNNIHNSLILGPSSANIPKVNNVYFIQIIIKYKNRKDIINQIQFIKQKYMKNNKLMIDIDFNPIKL